MKKRPKPYARPGKSSVTLKIVLNNLRDNDSYSENKQNTTQCVFLGVLKLKPVPSVFYSGHPSSSVPVGYRLRRLRSRTLSKDSNKNSAKSIINKVISGRISKKNPQTVKASVKKIPCSKIVQLKFNMTSQPTAESLDPNKLRLMPNVLTPEKVFKSQTVSVTPPRQFNPVQHLFDKVKQKMGETQSNSSLSSADFETHLGVRQPSEHCSTDASKRLKSSSKGSFKKQLTDTDNGDVVLTTETDGGEEQKMKQKERTSPRNKKSSSLEKDVIPTSDVIDLQRPLNSSNTKSDMVQRDEPSAKSKRSEVSKNLTVTDDTVTEKPKPRRSRLLPTAIPPIFLTAPRLLRSELAQKKQNTEGQKLKERISKSKIERVHNKSNSDRHSKVSPKANRDKKGSHGGDDDILFVSEEVKSPNDGDKPSLKLLIRQKKRSEIVAQETLSQQVAKQTQTQAVQVDASAPNQKKNDSIVNDGMIINECSDIRLLRSTKQTTPPPKEFESKVTEEVCCTEDSVVTEKNDTSENVQRIIDLEPEKPSSNEGKPNLKDSIINAIEEEGLHSLEDTNTPSAITENNNLSKTMLEQLASNNNSDLKPQEISVVVDEPEISDLQAETNKDITEKNVTELKEAGDCSEGKSTRSLRSNISPEVNKTEEPSNLEVAVINDEANTGNNPQPLDKPQSDINEAEQVIVDSSIGLEKKMKRLQRSVQLNASECVETKVNEDSQSSVPQDGNDEAQLRRSTRSKTAGQDQDENEEKPSEDQTVQVEVNDSSTEQPTAPEVTIADQKISKEVLENPVKEKVTKNMKARQSLPGRKPKNVIAESKTSTAIKQAQKRKSASETKIVKQAKQKKTHNLSSNENTVKNVDNTELLNVSLRALRSKTSVESNSQTPVKGKASLPSSIKTNESSLNKSRNKENKTEKKASKRNVIKDNTPRNSTKKVAPKKQSVQSKIGNERDKTPGRSRSTSRAGKLVTVPEPVTKNRKQNTVEKKKMNETKKDNSTDKRKRKESNVPKAKGVPKTQVKSVAKKQTVEKSNKTGKQNEKIKNKSLPTKPVVSKITATKKNVAVLPKKALRSDVSKKQPSKKVVVTSFTKAQVKRIVPKVLKSQQLMNSLNKNKPKKDQKGKDKLPTVKTAAKKKLPLPQNTMSTRSKGLINLKIDSETKKNQDKNTKTVRKSNKGDSKAKQVSQSSGSATRSKSKLEQNKKPLKTRAANKTKSEEDKNPVPLQTKNIKKAKSLLILKKKKLLIERIIKSTLKQLTVQKQMRQTNLRLKARALLRRKRQIQNRINLNNSELKENPSSVPEKSPVLQKPPPVSVATHTPNESIVQTTSNVVELAPDQQETIIFLTTTANGNCNLNELPVIENIADNIICLEVGNNVLNQENSVMIAQGDGVVQVIKPPKVAGSSKIVQPVESKVAVVERNDKVEKVTQQLQSLRRKRKLEVPTSSNVEEFHESSKIRKLQKQVQDEDLAQILNASEAVLKSIEQVTSTVPYERTKKKSGQLQKGKDLTVFDFTESDVEQETTPLRFKVTDNRNDEQVMQGAELSPENSQMLSPKKFSSPMKQATILEMFNRVATKNQKTGFTAVKSVYMSTPKIADNFEDNAKSEETTKRLLAEPLKEFERKCMKIDLDAEPAETTPTKKRTEDTVIPIGILRGLQKKCLKIHNTSISSDKQPEGDQTPAEDEEQESTPVNVINPVAIKASLKPKIKTDASEMPPPTKVKVVKKNNSNSEREGEEVFDDDDSRSEWMPQELAEYKMNYSAKKVNSYKPIYKCKVCLTIFPTHYKLTKHKQKHIETQNPYACKQCDESFKNVEDLVAHIRIHKGQHPYVCQKCDSGFWSKKAYDAHAPVHLLRKTKEAPKKFECDICKKKFAKLCDVERHSRVHTGEKPFVCNICNKRFQQTHNLSKHLLIHLNLKPFNCEICGKKFGRVDVLNRHVLTHSLIKPFKCCLCPKDFIRISQLNHHYKREHPDFVNTELESQFNPVSSQETEELSTIADAQGDNQSDTQLLEDLEAQQPVYKAEGTS